MALLSLHHVQLAMPRGGEATARAFFIGLLGFGEIAKPPHLAQRGGLWLQQGDICLHLGVEEPFAPARKAHPAFLTDELDILRRRLAEAGSVIAEDAPLPGFDRFFVADPFGNRLEFLQPSTAGEM